MEIGFKHFRVNKANPVSEAINRFFERQTLLDGTTYVIPHLRQDSKIDLSAGHAIYGSDDILLTHPKTFEVVPETREKFFDQLENYFYMGLLAQGVENFETFLKEVIRIADQDSKAAVSQKKGPKSNKERIKLIKDLSPIVANHIANKFKNSYDLFLLAERSRHIFVHAAMMADKDNTIRKLADFKSYFTITVVDGSDTLTITEAKTHELLSKISQVAYLIFEGVSKDLNLPITEIPEYLPPMWQRRQMIAQAKMQQALKNL